MARVLYWLVVVIPAAIFVVTLAVANRHTVNLVLDPFNPSNPAFSVPLPLFVWLFGCLFIGLLLGGFASWLKQGRWRRTARERTRDAYRWKSEADRLQRGHESASPAALPSA